ncbi:hypothetical protein HMPREF2767_08045 [Nosocomiicoccus sp. HMSC067E10]|uniref:hypothetical protein n=1 Tax=Nosocomiicoccus sp. HMSC067E10 TaxID=1739271 RepID=UPI0008A2C3D3|nr:hypothetical protein [Nosocomiicoccus sp. HMSC067E10]OFL48310.1 hypothetical protein HMPREF2767_08045 [Nosocomiicoccus sp. HMSC067E10]
MKKVLFAFASLLLILAACSKKDVAETEKPKNEVERSHQEAESDTEKDKEETETKEDTPLIAFEDLTTEHLLAMTIYDQQVIDEFNEYVLPTVDEIFAGEYSRPLYPGGESADVTNKIPEVSIISVDVTYVLVDTPQDPLTFYVVNPPSMGGMSVFAVGETYTLLYSSLGELTYQEALNYGHKYNIKELYEKHKNNENILNLIERMNSYENMEAYYKKIDSIYGE